jgi:hypothetical protein
VTVTLQLKTVVVASLLGCSKDHNTTFVFRVKQSKTMIIRQMHQDPSEHCNLSPDDKALHHRRYESSAMLL